MNRRTFVTLLCGAVIGNVGLWWFAARAAGLARSRQCSHDLQLSGYGDPAEVIKLVELPEFGPLAPDEYVIDVEAAPVEPTDQYIIAGIYGELPQLPHLLGCEGSGAFQRSVAM